MAGINTPNFFIDGENTLGKVNSTQAKPIMQITESILGRFVFLIDTNYEFFTNSTNDF